MEFCDRVRIARQRLGETQDELADRSGFHVTAISHYETGGREPSMNNLMRLADVLNVSTDYLVFGKEK